MSHENSSDDQPKRNWLLTIVFLIAAAVVIYMAIDYYSYATQPAAGALSNAVRDLDLTLTPRK